MGFELFWGKWWVTTATFPSSTLVKDASPIPLIDVTNLPTPRKFLDTSQYSTPGSSSGKCLIFQLLAKIWGACRVGGLEASPLGPLRSPLLSSERTRFKGIGWACCIYLAIWPACWIQLRMCFIWLALLVFLRLNLNVFLWRMSYPFAITAIASVSFDPAASFITSSVWSLRVFACVTPVMYFDSCISQWPPHFICACTCICTHRHTHISHTLRIYPVSSWAT